MSSFPNEEGASPPLAPPTAAPPHPWYPTAPAGRDDAPAPGFAYPPPPASSATSAGRPWTIAGLVCAIVALIFLPIILGPLGAVFGFVGNSKGDPKGRLVGIGAIVATVVGMALSLLVMNSLGTE